nr:hypothetical protein [Brevibacillus laterosporus]
MNPDEEKDKETITDVALEDRLKLKEIEVEAEEIVLRFFNAVNKRFANYEADDDGLMGAFLIVKSDNSLTSKRGMIILLRRSQFLLLYHFRITSNSFNWICYLERDFTSLYKVQQLIHIITYIFCLHVRLLFA